MAEAKEYISRPDEMGNIHISEEVLTVIAAAAAVEVEGVGGLTANFSSELAELLGKKVQGKGVHVQLSEEAVALHLSIQVKYGYAIPHVAREVQETVKSAVEATSGLEVAAVNVQVSSIVFDR